MNQEKWYYFLEIWPLKFLKKNILVWVGILNPWRAEVMTIIFKRGLII